ncbi:MAG: hypothetical protein JGK24_05460 [Microcoleus sp. PH2017_29_MFU_D_A]|uniref:hypothetical protein n=1 Tax=unclassified Microcoleus TaxID=2642155 RepID=UPI001DA692BB|nr:MULTISPECIES: hypothetical protein [unclassified Microcoleus]MCC3418242.1 hypothetical protein [Microcoleus sp. PH2017_07_MST_O_A]MCC3433272.1 hypothetical protein [Microcoleus sp. PH2017_04_SCI_O_A]MCC3443535.1 hypothetical protein [Microcoleus sp. PH2017_03_ELD_O_A]MCC3467750.1 hypothetical protein [Microcoleus sp. PH2017_06_SFM_O_A]MCC3503914.1 hypothetical protein [Microcoleus sp. PH2017_19_SFW_U_A]MCC3510294.1 hypothetical protein [Microcoleus sp. PH2017_17_BER_D_A]
MKSSTKYLTGKSTQATIGLVDGLINQLNRTGMVEGAKYPRQNTRYSTINFRGAIGAGRQNACTQQIKEEQIANAENLDRHALQARRR